jgi:molybdopterin converting factor small subunit
MSAKFIMPVFLQPVTNDRESIEVEGRTVQECLEIIIREYPAIRKLLMDKNGKLHNYVGVYINGKDAYPNEMEKEVKPGDEVHILYTLAGG